MKVLILGNDRSTYQWICEQITQPGQCPVAINASNLEEVKMMLKSIYFDVIIYSISDFKNTAKETAGQLKAISKKIPIVILTSISSLPVTIESVKMCADTYIIKESKLPGLVSQCLNTVISKKFDYVKRFSASGSFPQTEVSSNAAAYTA